MHTIFLYYARRVAPWQLFGIFFFFFFSNIIYHFFFKNMTVTIKFPLNVFVVVLSTIYTRFCTLYSSGTGYRRGRYSGEATARTWVSVMETPWLTQYKNTHAHKCITQCNILQARLWPSVVPVAETSPGPGWRQDDIKANNAWHTMWSLLKQQDRSCLDHSNVF